MCFRIRFTFTVEPKPDYESRLPRIVVAFLVSLALSRGFRLTRVDFCVSKREKLKFLSPNVNHIFSSLDWQSQFANVDRGDCPK